MSKSTDAYMDSVEEGYEAFIEHERNELRNEGKAEYKAELLRMIDVELSWRTQSEGFRGGLEWVKDQINETGRI